MSNSKAYTLDTWKPKVLMINTKQLDSDRTIIFNLKADGVAIDLTGKTVKYYVKKPDNTVVFNDCIISDTLNGVIGCKLTEQSLSVADTLKMEIVIIGTGGQESSFTVYLIVAETIIDPDALESSSEFTAFVTALGQVQDIDNQFASVNSSLAEIVTDVKLFGAKGDGITNDRQAILDTINYAKQNGYGIIFFPKGNYQLGNLAAAEVVFQLSGVSHLLLMSNNAKFLCTTIDQSVPTIFSIDNSSFVEFNGLQHTDSGTDTTINWKGSSFCDLNASTGNVNNIKFNNIDCDHVVAFLRAFSTGTNSVNTVSFDNIQVKNSYYGLNLVNAGDNFKGSIKTDNVKRSYFVYGVDGHDVNISSSNHPSGDYADVLLKTYAKTATRNLKIRYHAKGTQSTYYAMAFEHQQDTGNGIFENIEVDFDDALNTMGGSILFRSYTQAGVKETTTTNRFDNIRIKGMARAGIFMDVKPTAPGTLEISKGIMDIRKSILLNNWSGFYIMLGYQRYHVISQGQLSVNPILFDLSNVDGKAYAVKIKVWAWNNYSVLGSQETTCQEDILMGYNVTGSPVTILKTQNVIKVFNTTDAGINYSANGENVQINFPNYTNANGYAIATIELA